MQTQTNRDSWSGRRLAVTALAWGALLFIGAKGTLATQRSGPPPGGDPLPPEKQRRVTQAIKRGVASLRGGQLLNGSWSNGTLSQRVRGADARMWAVGYAALPGLTLLQCGTPPEDPAVQKAAHFVRQHIQAQRRTYELSLAVLFLDRLGAPGDRALIRSLTLRLAAGQTAHGGWWYDCPLLSPAQEKKLLQYLSQKGKDPKQAAAARPPAKGAKAVSYIQEDNSNTQFALLALWAARRYDLPLEYTVARTEQRFRFSQRPGGWGYLSRALSERPVGKARPYGSMPPYGSMTCAGLLGLAVGRGWSLEADTPRVERDQPKAEDKGITDALRALAGHLDDPSDSAAAASRSAPGTKDTLNVYFLWSVERIGILCNLKTIGGKDWYRWGVELLLPAQQADGSWFGKGYVGSSPTIDTCFALLFLKRADLAPGLREALQRRVLITDPGPSPNSTSPNPSPGERSPDQQGNPETPP